MIGTPRSESTRTADLTYDAIYLSIVSTEVVFFGQLRTNTCVSFVLPAVDF